MTSDSYERMPENLNTISGHLENTKPGMSSGTNKNPNVRYNEVTFARVHDHIHEVLLPTQIVAIVLMFKIFSLCICWGQRVPDGHSCGPAQLCGHPRVPYIDLLRQQAREEEGNLAQRVRIPRGAKL
ncbi:hypothetical protein FOPE_10860 [Fonsecaea pedrosoi]|nr:hypothetical protein FOPE_10860 [Fonsecaea pedrosoi]